MERYKGYKCEFCKEAFKEGDDVVVCPLCGAPYHRSCYLEMGECKYCKENEGKAYAPEKESANENNGETIRCRFCGSINDKNALFCGKCSRSLMDNSKSEPFSNGDREGYGRQEYSSRGYEENRGYSDYRRDSGAAQPQPNYMTYGGLDPEEEIDGCKVKDLAIAIGPSSPQYLYRFKEMKRKKSSISVSFSAFLFTYFFFFFRKMYKEAIFYALLSNIASIPAVIVYVGAMMNFNVTDNMQTLALILSYILLAVRFAFTLFANKIYMNKCIENVKKAKEKNLPEALCNEEIAGKGGVSMLSLYIAVIASVAFSVIISLILMR